MTSGKMAESAGWRRFAPLLFVGHFVLATAIFGWSAEYLIVDGLFLGVTLTGRKGRLLSWLALPIWIAGVVYANVQPLLIPFRGSVHVADLYAAELHWFGVPGPQGRQTLCEFFLHHHWSAVDFICGLVYLCYLVEPIPFAFYLFFKDQRRLSRLVWVFAIVHIANCITYIFYPAAPPWYVQEYGMGPAVQTAQASAAGVARFDDLLGVNIVHGFYEHSHNVFGAMPSGHCGSAILFAILAWGMGWRWFAPTALFALLMCFGAVYFQQHYVLDVVAGAVYAVLGTGLVVAAEAWWSGTRATSYQSDRGGLGEARC